MMSPGSTMLEELTIMFIYYIRYFDAGIVMNTIALVFWGGFFTGRVKLRSGFFRLHAV